MRIPPEEDDHLRVIVPVKIEQNASSTIAANTQNLNFPFPNNGLIIFPLRLLLSVIKLLSFFFLLVVVVGGISSFIFQKNTRERERERFNGRVVSFTERAERIEEEDGDESYDEVGYGNDHGRRTWKPSCEF